MESAVKTFNTMFKNYAEAIGKMYLKDKESILCCMSTGSVPGCLNECYQILVREGMTPIEKIETDEKYKYWKQSEKYGTEKKHRIEISRSLYLLEQLTKKEEENVQAEMVKH